MKPYLCIGPQCPATCEGCAYAVPPDDIPRQLIARLLCTFALTHDQQPFADGANALVDRARAYLREPGPRLWIVEHGAVGLPHGNPSRLTTFEAHDTEWDARAAAAASEFNSRVFSVFVPPDAGCCPKSTESAQAVDSQGETVLPGAPDVSGVGGPVPAPPRGVHALADVVSNLLQTGRYSDEEGEATARLLDLLKSLTDGALVPATPTQAMLDAADKVLDSDPRHIAEAWRAMVAAAGVGVPRHETFSQDTPTSEKPTP